MNNPGEALWGDSLTRSIPGGVFADVRHLGGPDRQAEEDPTWRCFGRNWGLQQRPKQEGDDADRKGKCREIEEIEYLDYTWRWSRNDVSGGGGLIEKRAGWPVNREKDPMRVGGYLARSRVGPWEPLDGAYPTRVPPSSHRVEKRSTSVNARLRMRMGVNSKILMRVATNP